MRCTPVGDGCLNCWHLRTADRLRNNDALPIEEREALAGSGHFVLRERELSAPLKAKKAAVIGVQFMGDLFHEEVPDDFANSAYRTMIHADWHTYLILTKQPVRMEEFVNLGNGWRGMAGNIRHGLTICNQQEADEKIPVFLQVPGNLFLSIEPMLGPIDLDATCRPSWCWRDGAIQCILLGGETGPGARPMHPDWVRSVRDQCQSAGVPFFFKQWGEWLPVGEMPTLEFKPIGGNDALSRFHLWGDFDKNVSMKIGRKAAGRLLDGKEHDDLPWRAKP